MFVHHLVLKKKKKNSETKIFITVKFLLEVKTKDCLTIFSKTIFAQGDVHISFGGKFHGKPFWMFVENVVRGNSVQTDPKFSRQKS